MIIYILRRLLLMIPTILGVMAANFLIVQAAPGGPVERTIAQIKGEGTDATARLTGGSDLAGGPQATPKAEIDARGSRGLPPELVAEIKRMYGFDKPPLERFLSMMRDYLTFDFGKSFFRDQRVVDLVIEKMPTSISIGLWTMLITYAVSIPLGIAKAVRDGSRFDMWSSAAVAIGYAIPGFLFAVLLIVVFAGGSYFSWFPLRGLTSDNWGDLSWPQRIVDYFWHLTLPIAAMAAGGFAGLAMLTKNSFVEEINKQYVLTARAKGCGEQRVLYRHIFRNAMLLVVAGFPAAFIGALFTGGLLIEVIFSLDGLGLLGFEAAINRDYPVMFGTLYFFTLLGLVMNLVGDLMYVAIDPRIDFAGRDA